MPSGQHMRRLRVGLRQPLWMFTRARSVLCSRFKSAGFSFSDVNSSFMERLLRFCRENIEVLRDEQRQIQKTEGIHYPLMKLVDM
jgi:hypothetical protein